MHDRTVDQFPEWESSKLRNLKQIDNWVKFFRSSMIKTFPSIHTLTHAAQSPNSQLLFADKQILGLTSHAQWIFLDNSGEVSLFFKSNTFVSDQHYFCCIMQKLDKNRFLLEGLDLLSIGLMSGRLSSQVHHHLQSSYVVTSFMEQGPSATCLLHSSSVIFNPLISYTHTYPHWFFFF